MAKRMVYDVQMVRSGPGWEVRREGGRQASARATSQEVAVERARAIAANYRLSQIRVRSPYGEISFEIIDGDDSRNQR
jgi:Uncharacterized protein conserved in bacteria (DUF2188)